MDTLGRYYTKDFVSDLLINNLLTIAPQRVLDLGIGDASHTLVTGKEYKLFREVLMTNFNLSSIIQLPDKIFNKTEARTHILIISKKKPISDTCELYLANYEGILSDKIIATKNALIERMDYN